MRYRIYNRQTGLDYGTYDGETEFHALCAMLEDAGDLDEVDLDAWVVEHEITASVAAALLGKKGGQSKTEAKQKASRENGKKGGRPKRTN